MYTFIVEATNILTDIKVFIRYANTNKKSVHLSTLGQQDKFTENVLSSCNTINFRSEEHTSELQSR